MLFIIVHFVHCLEYIYKSVKTKKLETLKSVNVLNLIFLNNIYVLCHCTHSCVWSMIFKKKNIKTKKQKKTTTITTKSFKKRD